MNRISKLAVVVVLLGTVLLAGPIFGFSTLAADRGVGLTTASGSSALLGIQDENVVVDSHKDPVQIVTIHNNLEENVTLEDMEVTVGEGLAREQSFNGSIDTGGTTSLSVTCTQGSGAGTTDVTINIQTAETSNVLIEGVSKAIAVERGEGCPGQPNNGGGGNNQAGPDSGETHTGDLSPDGDDVATGSNSEVTGKIDTDGDVSTGSESTVGGDIDSDGEVTTGWSSEVDGDISAGDDITISSESTISGSLDSDGSVTTGWSTTVEGPIDADGSVTIRTDSVITGDVSGGEITIRSNAEIQGDIDADGDVTIRNGAEITGEIDADGSIDDNR